MPVHAAEDHLVAIDAEDVTIDLYAAKAQDGLLSVSPAS
jgi:hypothetical protein